MVFPEFRAGSLSHCLILALTQLRWLSHSVGGVISLNGIYRPWGYGLAWSEACFLIVLVGLLGHSSEFRPAKRSNLTTNKRQNQAAREPRGCSSYGHSCRDGRPTSY